MGTDTERLFDEDRRSHAAFKEMVARVRAFAVREDDPESARIEATSAVEALAWAGREMWRCFHCDMLFTDRTNAARHFGEYISDTPRCIAVLRDFRQRLGLEYKTLGFNDWDALDAGLRLAILDASTARKAAASVPVPEAPSDGN